METVYVGYPHGGKIDGDFADCLDALHIWEVENPSPRYKVVGFRGEKGPYVQENRNVLVRRMRDAGADWLFQLDPDETFEPNLLRVLMRHAAAERPILTGLYSNIGNVEVDGQGSFEVVDMVFAEVPSGEYQNLQIPADLQPFEVHACGAGVLLVHRSVFETMEYPWFRLGYIVPEGAAGPQVMNEDIAFCRDVRELGFHIWCDPLAVVSHWKIVPLVPSVVQRMIEQAEQVRGEMADVARRD